MGDLEEVSQHVQDRISSLRRTLDLSVIDFPQNKMKKLGQEIFALEKLLEDFERCVDHQRDQLTVLKELEASLHKDLEDVSHMKENIPAHMPKKEAPAPAREAVVKAGDAADVQPPQQEQVKKSSRTFIRQMDFITVAEFDSIPLYMRGRVSYDQLNAAVQGINTSVTAKYKILHQPIRSLNNHSRKLQQRFKEQETKDTKGQFFVVEDDIREFSQVKVDKRFQGILNMLRHCQRIRELRGGGLTRFLLL
ncbi:spindle and kinetochore-associated protein 1 [Cheilinus undulatus]|uniref:spindle and kinetochore-associated protein 1 n=1 Tax=Cheilinus undulatus TaxID=241271 RepID=UPI001BD20B17|nr:spindle and kinetochore-associated protein 1 [Cheilinus undulatus]XP_041652538.1 spindle and kinetochore-associated protein 1 [Cheilinus undulatus]